MGAFQSGGSVAEGWTHKECQDDDGQEKYEVQDAGDSPLLVEHLSALSTRTDEEPDQSQKRQPGTKNKTETDESLPPQKQAPNESLYRM